MIPFSPPWIDDQTVEAVTEVLRSGWITTGPKTKLFEQKLTDYCGNRKTLCVNSATAGLELALQWFGVQNGDEVIVPAYTYCATANVVIHCGAKPVLVDIGEDFNIDVNAVRAAITSKTKAIVPVDIAGFPCDYEDLIRVARNSTDLFNPSTEAQETLGRHLVLADAAHSIGARYKGKMSGSLADITVFSFHATKNLTTAEGGAICFDLPDEFDTDELYNHLNIKILHGQSRDALAKLKKGGWNYDVAQLGTKCNMTDIEAAMGLAQLERYENDMLIRRKAIFEQYNQAFFPYDWAQVPPSATDCKTSSYHAYLLRIANITEQQRNRIIEKIFERDVAVNVHYKPLPLLSYYKQMGYRMDQYPNALDNYSREISLPVYYDLSDRDIGRVIKAVVHSVQDVIY